MTIIVLKVLIYLIAMSAFVLFTRSIVYIRRRSPPKLKQQFAELLYQTEPWYRDDKLDQAMSSAGLSMMNAWMFKLCRDLIALLIVIALHVQFLYKQQYPVKALVLVAILYTLFLTGRSWMPMTLFLGSMKKGRIQKKNDDIVSLYMLFTNDTYTETEDHYQSVISKLKDYRSDMNALRGDVDQLIFDYEVEGKQAFEAFGERVATKEAKMLARLMEKMNESSPETAADLLEQHYETFLDYRRQRRKRQLRANGHVGFSIAMLAIIVVIFLTGAITEAYQEMLVHDSQY